MQLELHETTKKLQSVGAQRGPEDLSAQKRQLDDERKRNEELKKQLDEQKRATDSKHRQVEEKERALSELDKQLKKRKEHMDQLEISLQKVKLKMYFYVIMFFYLQGWWECGCSWRTEQEVSRSRKEFGKIPGRIKEICCRNGTIVTVGTNESRRAKCKRKANYGFTAVS